MARYFPLLETRIVLRTMIFGAGTAAGATWDMYPGVEVMEEMCESAISDAAIILGTCKNLVEDF